MKIAAVDLFCGVGGITHGFLQAGLPVLAGYDLDVSCRYSYEVNNGARFIHCDIQNLDSEVVAQEFPTGCLKVIIGCAPCQPFSKYTNQYQKKTLSIDMDPRFGLLSHFRRIVSDVLPEIISMENVPELLQKGHTQYKEFINALEINNYYISDQIVDCSEYGVPQSRKRLVLLASTLGPITLLPPTHKGAPVTVREAIGTLPPIAQGESCSSDPLHKSSRLSPLNLKRIKLTPEGGGWHSWPMALRSPCHRRESGATYSSVYGRMRWDEVSPTITTQSYSLGTGRFGHPEQHRALSLRECALLQTFPINYQFTAPDETIFYKSVGRHIGNAVPVRLAKVIAMSILTHIAQRDI